MTAPGNLRFRSIAALTGLLLAIALGCSAQGRSTARAEDLAPIDVKERFLERIPAGVEIGKKAPRGWTHLVFIATPSIAEGDVDALPGMAKDIASMLQLTVLANARKEKADGGDVWRLDKVAVGFATPIGDKRVIIDSASEGRLGANLNFIERSVLSSQEKYLGEDRGVLQVVTAPNMVVFDAKSVMLVGKKHRQMKMRHAIVVDPKSGGMGALVWLLDPTNKGFVLAEDAMQLLPSNLHETRKMHVDAAQITFGIPGPTALAIVSIPQGTAIPFTPELQEVAALARFTPETAARLESEIWRGLAAAGVK